MKTFWEPAFLSFFPQSFQPLSETNFAIWGIFISLLRVLRICSRSMEFFRTVCLVLQNMLWLFFINGGVAHLLTELPCDSRWWKEESYLV